MIMNKRTNINEFRLNERKNEYLRIGDIVDLLKENDEFYNHEPWTLEQIFANLNLLVGVCKEDVNLLVDTNKLCKWMPICGHKVCLICGYKDSSPILTNYCPNCGADMRGVDDD